MECIFMNDLSGRVDYWSSTFIRKTVYKWICVFWKAQMLQGVGKLDVCKLV